jgi:hypothetical protein
VATVKLPALVGYGWSPIEVVRPGARAAGWALFEFASVAAARVFMRANPQAAMPCWRRPDLFAAEEAAERVLQPIEDDQRAASEST